MTEKITYRIELDIYQDCIERIARKIEADGEEALTLALKEHGFEKVVRCRDCIGLVETWDGWECERFSGEYHRAEPDGFCAWGERTPNG